MTDAKKSPKPKPGLKRSISLPSQEETAAVAGVLERMLGNQPAPAEAIQVTTSTSSTPGTTSTGSTTSTSPPPANKAQELMPVAPTRDFMRVANSIVRDALPAGLLQGKGKQIYDYLYSLTRGAIVPRRSVRLTIKQIMQGTATGSDVTVRKNIKKLTDAGLLETEQFSGPHEGNEYRVYLPEEVGLSPYTPSTPGTTSTTSTSRTHSTSGSTTQKVPVVPLVESTPGMMGRSIEDSIGSERSHTLINTRSHDDDLKHTLRELLPTIKEEELQKSATEIMKLILDELRASASRASSPPVTSAFFVECIRRLCAAPVRKEGKPRAGTVKSLETQIKALASEAGREHPGASYEQIVEMVERRTIQKQIEISRDQIERILQGRQSAS